VPMAHSSGVAASRCMALGAVLVFAVCATLNVATPSARHLTNNSNVITLKDHMDYGIHAQDASQSL
jgi:hypothetical protein